MEDADSRMIAFCDIFPFEILVEDPHLIAARVGPVFVVIQIGDS